MKRRNKYTIQLRTRPNINITASTRRAGHGSVGKWLIGLIFLIPIPFGLSIALQFLQQKLLASQALLFVPAAPLLLLSTLTLVLLSGSIGISLINHRMYINRFFLVLCLSIILITQFFFVRLTGDGINCRQLVWEKTYHWSDIHKVEIGISSLLGYPNLDYQVFTKDGNKIALNPGIYFLHNMKVLVAADNLMKDQKILIRLKKIDDSVLETMSIDAKNIIDSHTSVSSQQQ